MRQFNVWIFISNFIDDFAPQNRRLQYVSFINRRNFTATFASGFKRDTRNTFDLETVINLGIKGFFMLSAAFAAFWLTEVNPASQFAYAQDVETVRGNICAQRAKRFQPLVELSRAQVAE